jgi:hypothetical protein
MTEDTITVMQMSQTPDDVSISRVKSFHGDLLDIYADVRNCAISFAREFDLTSDKKSLVEIERNLEGLPTAYIYEDGKIMHMFYGTYKSADDSRWQEAMGVSADEI